jgi:hypothetical protein
VPPRVNPSGIIGFRSHKLVFLRDELEGQAAPVRDRAAPHGTILKTFEHQNRLALEKAGVHSEISLGGAEAPGVEPQKAISSRAECPASTV